MCVQSDRGYIKSMTELYTILLLIILTCQRGFMVASSLSTSKVKLHYPASVLNAWHMYTTAVYKEG